MVSKFSKLALATGLALGSTMVFAESTPYVGLMAGWDDVAADIDTSTSVLMESASVSGLNGTIVGGFEIPMPGGFINFEASIGDSSAEYVEESATSALTITKNIGYGVDALFGTNLNRSTILFGSLGYKMVDMEFASNSSGSGRSDTEETFSGASAGVGLQTELTDMVDVRLHWTRTFYAEEEISLSNNSLQFEVKPTGNSFSIGVIGKF